VATTPRRGLPFVFVTWITGLCSGDDQCLWSAWFRARYKYDKFQNDGFDSAAWSADHAALVAKRVKEFEIDGAKVRLEQQNWIRVPGETAILIGKPDIVSELGGQFTIADGKTGTVQKKHWWQGLWYLYMLPRAWQNPHLRVDAELFYATGQRIGITAHEFTPELKQHAFGIMRRIADPIEPSRTPSIPECRYCDIPQCPDRMSDTQDLTPMTDGDF